jgi:hypothetical protein
MYLVKLTVDITDILRAAGKDKSTTTAIFGDTTILKKLIPDMNGYQHIMASYAGNYVLVWAPNDSHPILDYDFTYDTNDVFPGIGKIELYDMLEAKRIKVESSLMAKFDLTSRQMEIINKYRLGKLLTNNESRITELEEWKAKVTAFCHE